MNRKAAIEEYRKNEDVESLLVLTGKGPAQDKLRRVALAYAKTPVQGDMGAEVGEGWEAAWEGVEIDVDRIGEISGAGNCRRQIESLRGYRLIYPDGTLAGVAQKALRALAKGELGL